MGIDNEIVVKPPVMRACLWFEYIVTNVTKGAVGNLHVPRQIHIVGVIEKVHGVEG